MLGVISTDVTLSLILLQLLTRNGYYSNFMKTFYSLVCHVLVLILVATLINAILFFI